MRDNARGLLALGSLAAIAAGFWMAWPPLGLIVPGAIVLGLLVWGHLRGQAAEPPPPADDKPE